MSARRSRKRVASAVVLRRATARRALRHSACTTARSSFDRPGGKVMLLSALACAQATGAASPGGACLALRFAREASRLKLAQLHRDVDALLFRHRAHASGDAPTAATAAPEAASPAAAAPIDAACRAATAPGPPAATAATTIAGHWPRRKGTGGRAFTRWLAFTRCALQTAHAPFPARYGGVGGAG